MAALETAVPESLRLLLPLARRFGVGDDLCRAYFIRRATKVERARALVTARYYFALVAAVSSAREPLRMLRSP